MGEKVENNNTFGAVTKVNGVKGKWLWLSSTEDPAKERDNWGSQSAPLCDILLSWPQSVNRNGLWCGGSSVGMTVSPGTRYKSGEPGRC